MSIIIRDVLPADMAAITRIYAHAVLYGTASFELDPPSNDDMTRRMDALVAQGFPYVVAVDQRSGELLGYAYAGLFRTRPAYRWTVENSVYIDEAAHGRGLGKALTAHLIERCAALGFRQMIAIIGGSNHIASIRMHQSLGFTHQGNLAATGFKHGQWLDTVIMQLALGDGAKTDPSDEGLPGTLT
ncbi:MAG: N-acetyltransferase family protein [Ahrensia sp.]